MKALTLGQPSAMAAFSSGESPSNQTLPPLHQEMKTPTAKVLTAGDTLLVACHMTGLDPMPFRN
jgi:hypothetical protein